MMQSSGHGQMMDEVIVTKQNFEQNRDVFRIPSWAAFKQVVLGDFRDNGVGLSRGGGGYEARRMDSRDMIEPSRKRMRVAEPPRMGGMVQMAQPIYQPISQPAPPPPQRAPQPQTRPGEAIVRIQVEGTQVSSIIGKKGAEISQLQRDSRTKIDVEKLPYGQRHMPCIVTITGDKGGITTAVQKITQQVSATLGDQDKIQFCIPEHQCGMIIGKRGANVQRIEKENEGLRVDINKQPQDFDFGTVSMCTLTGPSEAVVGGIENIVKDLFFAWDKEGPVPRGGGSRGGGGMRGGGGFVSQQISRPQVRTVMQPTMVPVSMSNGMGMVGGGQPQYMLVRNDVADQVRNNQGMMRDRRDDRGMGGGARGGGFSGGAQRRPAHAPSNGGSQRRPGDWDCSDCGAMNFASRTQCFKCNAPKPNPV